MAMSTAATPHDTHEQLSRAELSRALHDGSVTLVDVLSFESFERRHIPGAINLPVASISMMAASVMPDRRAAIVTYCGGPT